MFEALGEALGVVLAAFVLWGLLDAGADLARKAWRKVKRG